MGSRCSEVGGALRTNFLRRARFELVGDEARSLYTAADSKFAEFDAKVFETMAPVQL